MILQDPMLCPDIPEKKAICNILKCERSVRRTWDQPHELWNINCGFICSAEVLKNCTFVMRQYSVAEADAKFCLQPGAELATSESGGRCIKNQIPGPDLRASRCAFRKALEVTLMVSQIWDPPAEWSKSTTFGSIHSFRPQIFIGHLLVPDTI